MDQTDPATAATAAEAMSATAEAMSASMATAAEAVTATTAPQVITYVFKAPVYGAQFGNSNVMTYNSADSNNKQVQSVSQQLALCLYAS